MVQFFFALRKLGMNSEQVVHRNMIHPARSVIQDENLAEQRVVALAKANALMDVMFSD